MSRNKSGRKKAGTKKSGKNKKNAGILSSRGKSRQLSGVDLVAALSAELPRQLGEVELPGQVEEFAEALLDRFANVMRFRREIDPQRMPVEPHPLPWYRLAHRAAEDQQSQAFRFSRTLDYAAGDYFLQDAGSLLALAAADVDGDSLGGKLVCDLCAAPGGKSSALAEALAASDQPGFLLANEPIRSRLGPLKFNLARTGSDRFAISQLDPDELALRLPAVFDVVLVDAPCSGQALLGRGKQQLAAVSAKQVEHSAARQRRILTAAVQLLKPGGRLVYSTCTFAEAENEAQQKFLVENSNVIVDPVERLAPYETGPGSYRLWPHRHQCAGSFAASLRSEMTDRPAMMTETSRSHAAKENEKAIRRLLENLESCFCLDPTSARFVLSDSVLNVWPEDVPDWVESIAVAGPELAYRIHQVWKPAHNGALIRNSSVFGPSQRCTATDEQASAFLRGEPIACAEVGWCCVVHQDRPLGWVKSDGKLGKNHLPAAGRMDVTTN